MRIPWYIATPLAVAVFCSVLWIGARTKDFNLPPSDQDVTESVASWKIKHPPLPPRQRVLPAPPEMEVETTPAPAPKATPTIEPGNLSSKPPLDWLIEHRALGAASYIDLAVQLNSDGKLSHSLLAWERVIDSSDTNEAQAATAHKAITLLRESLPIWNSDSSDNFDLIIHINTPEQWKAQISSALGALSESIQHSSSFIVAPQILLKTIPSREGFPSPPVRIWLSSTGTPQKETPQLTFRIKDTSLEKSIPLEEQLHLAIYRSISGQFQQIKDIEPPADITQADSAKVALSSYMTRLHWQKLCDSLFIEEPKPAAAIIIEEGSDQE